jgi:hypothetical protein
LGFRSVVLPCLCLDWIDQHTCSDHTALAPSTRCVPQHLGGPTRAARISL